MGYQVEEKNIRDYRNYLVREEREKGTIQKYMRDIHAFLKWLGKQDVSKELVLKWKEALCKKEYAASTVNSMLSAVNGFFQFMGWTELKLKFLKIQNRTFRDQEKDLCRREYERLLSAARQQGKERLSLLMETICGTGIRVSEVKNITMEAVKKGRAEISMKGKNRIILISNKLQRKLLLYAKKQKIVSGAIFLTEKGNILSRQQIWQEMKDLCKEAGVERSKVFPHNLRHLFATVFYAACKDIVKLADVLGHSSIETTRIYLISTGEEHMKQLDGLGLVQ